MFADAERRESTPTQWNKRKERNDDSVPEASLNPPARGRFAAGNSSVHQLNSKRI
jgi:hypothetical protein